MEPDTYYTDGPDYDIALTPLVQKRLSSDQICSLITRTLSHAPGDSDDIENIMQIVSASVDEVPSVRQFECPEFASTVYVLFRPKDYMMLLVFKDEVLEKGTQDFINAFGFKAYEIPSPAK